MRYFYREKCHFKFHYHFTIQQRHINVKQVFKYWFHRINRIFCLPVSINIIKNSFQKKITVKKTNKKIVGVTSYSSIEDWKRVKFLIIVSITPCIQQINSVFFSLSQKNTKWGGHYDFPVKISFIQLHISVNGCKIFFFPFQFALFTISSGSKSVYTYTFIFFYF